MYAYWKKQGSNTLFLKPDVKFINSFISDSIFNAIEDINFGLTPTS